MEDGNLYVFSLSPTAPQLRSVLKKLKGAGHPVGLSTGKDIDAPDEVLDSLTWDAVFLRWLKPTPHEVVLLERTIVDQDEEADAALAEAATEAGQYPPSGGQYIVADQLRRASAVYVLQLQPALLTDEDHPAWEALNSVVEVLASETDGMIYAPHAGFYDAEGEVLLDGDDLPESGTQPNNDSSHGPQGGKRT